MCVCASLKNARSLRKVVCKCTKSGKRTKSGAPPERVYGPHLPTAFQLGIDFVRLLKCDIPIDVHLPDGSILPEIGPPPDCLH